MPRNLRGRRRSESYVATPATFPTIMSIARKENARARMQPRLTPDEVMNGTENLPLCCTQDLVQCLDQVNHWTFGATVPLIASTKPLCQQN